MKTNSKRGIICIQQSAIVVALGLSGSLAFAAGTANDTASNYSGTGWSAATTPNNGSGFGAWNVTLSGGGAEGTYLSTGSAVATGGYAWGTYANSSGTAEISISRAFTAGASSSSSLYNQTFSVDLTSAGIGPSQGELAIGFGNAFSFSYLGTGSDNFLFSVDGATPITTSVNYSELSAGIDVSLSVNGALASPTEDYTLTVTAVGGGSLYTTSGTFDSSAYNTSSFNYLDSNTTGDNFFNNLSISPESVPEPSTLALCGLSGVAGLVAIRRRR